MRAEVKPVPDDPAPRPEAGAASPTVPSGGDATGLSVLARGSSHMAQMSLATASPSSRCRKSACDAVALCDDGGFKTPSSQCGWTESTTVKEKQEKARQGKKR